MEPRAQHLQTSSGTGCPESCRVWMQCPCCDHPGRTEDILKSPSLGYHMIETIGSKKLKFSPIPAPRGLMMERKGLKTAIRRLDQVLIRIGETRAQAMMGETAPMRPGLLCSLLVLCLNVNLMRGPEDAPGECWSWVSVHVPFPNVATLHECPAHAF